MLQRGIIQQGEIISKKESGLSMRNPCIQFQDLTLHERTDGSTDARTSRNQYASQLCKVGSIKTQKLTRNSDDFAFPVKVNRAHLGYAFNLKAYGCNNIKQSVVTQNVERCLNDI